MSNKVTDDFSKAISCLLLCEGVVLRLAQPPLRFRRDRLLFGQFPLVILDDPDVVNEPEDESDQRNADHAEENQP